MGQRRRELEPPEGFLHLEYGPGQDAQCDFGEAQVILAGTTVTAQFFCMRLCYSKAPFVWAFPHQRQEAFFEGQRRGLESESGLGLLHTTIRQQRDNEAEGVEV